MALLLVGDGWRATPLLLLSNDNRAMYILILLHRY
jgi:hypothetical protein